MRKPRRCHHTENLSPGRDECRSCWAARGRWRYHHNGGRAKALARYRAKREKVLDQYRLQRYGMNRWNYEALLECQDGRCLICKQTMSRPCVDHDHQTGQVRGLLCSPCNTAIGMLKDNPAWCVSAAEYLKETAL